MDGAIRPTSEHEALVGLLHHLDRRGYHFVPPTPATHARVVARPTMREARDDRGIFGWSLPFRAELLPAPILELLTEGGLIEPLEDGRARALVRVSTVKGHLFAHSAFPTDAKDSVFLGPDTLRFVDFVQRSLPPDAERIVDLGAGTGVAGILVGRWLTTADVCLVDVNPRALAMARANAASASARVRAVMGKGLFCLDGDGPAPDLVIANPPYLVDAEHRMYRDGGGQHGTDLAVEWATEALQRLAPRGRFVLYTGAPIVDGRDELRDRLQQLCASQGARISYRELDPDIFAEELERPEYADVERIAAVGAVLHR